MTATYNLATVTGQMRLVGIADTDLADPVFQDEEYAAFYSLESNNFKRAVALLLETIASKEAYIQKVIKLLDLQTDGAKLSDALLKRAAQLRKQADEDEARSGQAWAIAEWSVSDFAAREIEVNEWLRELH